MSIGDIKGARRRQQERARRSEAPKKAGLSVSEMINRNRQVAARQAKATKKK